jgi:hypothetical protein
MMVTALELRDAIPSDHPFHFDAKSHSVAVIEPNTLRSDRQSMLTLTC